MSLKWLGLYGIKSRTDVSSESSTTIIAYRFFPAPHRSRCRFTVESGPAEYARTGNASVGRPAYEALRHSRDGLGGLGVVIGRVGRLQRLWRQSFQWRTCGEGGIRPPPHPMGCIILCVLIAMFSFCGFV